ncbi:RNA polymerase sigma factor [Cryptosporangium sp. NPDC048952]|uniref:RNA polymerase sigma factor n=1 Tax=Cryptosporangium sp. NPDC048952 TaxID=3363961 RepID=UPI00371BDF4F
MPESIQAPTSSDAAYEDFYRANHAHLIRFAIALGASVDDAQDLAQDALIATLTGWSNILEPVPYTKTVVRHMFFRMRQTRLRESEAYSTLGRRPAPQNGSLHEEKEYVLSLLNDLPHHRRQILAHLVDGYAPREIAELLGKNPATIRSHIRHARNALARHTPQPKYRRPTGQVNSGVERWTHRTDQGSQSEPPEPSLDEAPLPGSAQTSPSMQRVELEPTAKDLD